MNRVIWEEGKDYREPFRSTFDADDAFIEMMEGYLVKLFDDAGSLAVRAKKETINPKDLYLASRLQRDHKLIVSTSQLEENFWKKGIELGRKKQDMRGGRESFLFPQYCVLCDLDGGHYLPLWSGQ
jgi:histone H3/H4